MKSDYSTIAQQSYLHKGHVLRDWNFDMDLAQGTSHLDIGCGTGAYLLFKSNASKKVGIDLDSKALAFAPDELETYHLSLDDYHGQNPVTHFDYVSAFEVVEHIADPAEFFATCYAALEPGGTLFGSTPNSTRLWLNFFPREPFDFPPNHLHYFNREEIDKYLKSAGFTSVKVFSAFKLPSYGSVIYRVNILTKLKIIKLLLLFPVFLILLIGNLIPGKWLHHGFIASKR